MDLLEAIRTRRHVKFFKPDPVDMNLVEKWLEAASYAPNHRMAEPWEVIVVGEKTRELINHPPNFGNAPLVLAILSKRAEKQVDRDENLMAVSCFIQNFSLLAHEQGVGVRWTSIGWSDAARQALGVDESYDVANILGIGYPVEVPEVRPRTRVAEKIKQVP